MPLDEVELRYDEDEDNILINKKRAKLREEREIKEKELSELQEVMRRFMDITLENQKIITNVVRSNESLREDLAVLIGKVDRLFDKFEDFVEVIKAAAEEDSEEHLAHNIVKTTLEPFLQKFEEFSKGLQESNQMMLEVLTSIDKRMKRLQSSTTGNTAESLKERMMQLLASRQMDASSQPSVPSVEQPIKPNTK